MSDLKKPVYNYKLFRKVAILGYKELFKNKKLLFFPICSSVVVIMAIYIITNELPKVGDVIFANGSLVRGLIALLVLPLTFLVTVISLNYFNVCMYFESNESLKGNSVSITRGLKSGFCRLKTVSLWTLYYIYTMFGLPHGLMIYFALTAICFEGIVDPGKAIEASKNTIKSIWGDKKIIAIINTGFIGYVIFFIILYLPGEIVGPASKTIAVSLILWITVLIACINYSVNIILKNLLYQYANNKFTSGLSNEEIQNIGISKD